MITMLPDPQIQKQELERKRLEPRNKFLFLWDKFFTTRKFRLSLEDAAELENMDKSLSKWEEASNRIWNVRNNPQEVFDFYVGRYLKNPTEETYLSMISHTFSTPMHQILMGRAGERFTSHLVEQRRKMFVPVVRRHLEKIYFSLLHEYEEQMKADEKSLRRLEGIASGGESQAAITLRIRAEQIHGILENGDLSNWRECLGAFLP